MNPGQPGSKSLLSTSLAGVDSNPSLCDSWSGQRVPPADAACIPQTGTPAYIQGQNTLLTLWSVSPGRSAPPARAPACAARRSCRGAASRAEGPEGWSGRAQATSHHQQTSEEPAGPAACGLGVDGEGRTPRAWWPRDGKGNCLLGLSWDGWGGRNFVGASGHQALWPAAPAGEEGSVFPCRSEKRRRSVPGTEQGVVGLVSHLSLNRSHAPVSCTRLRGSVCGDRPACR